MPIKNYRSIVVDASIACSCGESGLQEIRGKACRDFLLVFYKETEHHAVMTELIGDEWNKHSHSYARKWRRWMEGSGRVDHLNIDKNKELEKKIESLDASNHQ